MKNEATIIEQCPFSSVDLYIFISFIIFFSGICGKRESIDVAQWQEELFYKSESPWLIKSHL